MLVVLEKAGPMDVLGVHEIVQLGGASGEVVFGHGYWRWLTGQENSVPISELESCLPFEDVDITFAVLLPRIKTGSSPGHTLVCQNRYQLG